MSDLDSYLGTYSHFLAFLPFCGGFLHLFTGKSVEYGGVMLLYLSAIHLFHQKDFLVGHYG